MQTSHDLSRRPIKTEFRALFQIGGPIAVTQLAHNGISVADTLMAGQVSPQDLAGVAVGASIWVPLFLFMTGVIIATTALVSHAFGGGRHGLIVHLVRQSAWMALALAIGATLLCRTAPFYLSWFQLDPAVKEIAEGYLRGISWGVPAIALYQVLRCYCEAQTDTRSVMVLTLIALAINIPANYLLIHGGFGIPPLGGAGCGYATALVMWISLGLMIGYIRYSKRYRQHDLFGRLEAPARAQLNELFRLGLPIGLAIFFEAGLFCAATLALTPFGAVPIAAHQIALSITSLTFMIPLSIAMATTVRVGNLLGQAQPVAARFSSFSAIGLGLAFAVLTASCMVLFRNIIAGWYSPDALVQHLAGQILLVAALFQFSDAIQVTCSGALRAYKDTRVIMLITLVAYWFVGFPIGLYLGYSGPVPILQGATGLWIGLAIGLTAAALLLLHRLNQRSRVTA